MGFAAWWRRRWQPRPVTDRGDMSIDDGRSPGPSISGDSIRDDVARPLGYSFDWFDLATIPGGGTPAGGVEIPLLVPPGGAFGDQPDAIPSWGVGEVRHIFCWLQAAVVPNPLPAQPVVGPAILLAGAWRWRVKVNGMLVLQYQNQTIPWAWGSQSQQPLLTIPAGGLISAGVHYTDVPGTTFGFVGIRIQGWVRPRHARERET